MRETCVDGRVRWLYLSARRTKLYHEMERDQRARTQTIHGRRRGFCRVHHTLRFQITRQRRNRRDALVLCGLCARIVGFAALPERAARTFLRTRATQWFIEAACQSDSRI